MIGAIASFVFKTAGEAVGFLAKHAWLLILAAVTIMIEKLKKNKGLKNLKIPERSLRPEKVLSN